MTRAVVVKVYGDQNLGNAIAKGLTPEQYSLVKREIQHRKLPEALEALNKPRDIAYWREMTAKARAAHRVAPVRLRALLVFWALMWYGIDKAYRHLSAINRAA